MNDITLDVVKVKDMVYPSHSEMSQTQLEAVQVQHKPCTVHS